MKLRHHYHGELEPLGLVDGHDPDGVGMLLDHLGEAEAADRLRAGLERVLDDGKVRTRDLGGEAGTDAFAVAVAEAVKAT